MIEKNILKYKVMVELLDYAEVIKGNMKAVPTAQEVADRIIKHVMDCHYIGKEERDKLFASPHVSDRASALAGDVGLDAP